MPRASLFLFFAVLAGFLLGCDSAPEPPEEEDCTPEATASGPVGEWEFLGLGGEEIDDITAIAVHPCDPSVIYAGSSSDASSGIRGMLFKSTDGGETWDTLLVGGRYSDIQFAPSDPGVIYALPGSLIKSTDGGKTWQTVAPDVRAPVQSLAIHPEKANVLYAGAGSAFVGGDGLYKSTDGGASWQEVGKETALENGVTSVAIDPDNPDVIYAGTAGSASIAKSTDGGKTWSTLAHKGGIVDNLGISPRSENVYAGIRSRGVFSSKDGGTTWDKEALPDSVETALGIVFPPEQKGVYVATDEGLFHKPSGAPGWTPMNEDLSHEFAAALSMSPKGWDLYLGLHHVHGETGIYVRQIER